MAHVVLGMLGFGTVGTGVVKLLNGHKSLKLKAISVREVAKLRVIAPPCTITDNPKQLVDDPEIEILVEVMGGEQPAFDLIKRAIEKKKHIVTANKELLAKHGPELFNLAEKQGVAIFFEASVAGGIPLISTIHKGLGANQISSVCGILNGTTNFILSSMEKGEVSFEQSLKMAQTLGYAESNPMNDIEGFDVAYKLSILSALAFGKFANPDEIYRQGISKIDPIDFIQARQFGFSIKLLGNAKLTKAGPAIRVEPCLVPLSHPLASVSGVNNGIVVTGNAVGELMMIGSGAGEMPTASAVVGDIINLASALKLPDFASYFQATIDSRWAQLACSDNWYCPYYLRLIVADHPGVIGQIGTIFGKHNLSIQSIVQRGMSGVQNITLNGDLDDSHSKDTVSVVIMTHNVKAADIQGALIELSKCNFMRKQAACIAVYEPEKGNA